MKLEYFLKIQHTEFQEPTLNSCIVVSYSKVNIPAMFMQVKVGILKIKQQDDYQQNKIPKKSINN